MNDGQKPTPYLLTVKQTAERLQFDAKTIYELVNAKENPIPSIRKGRAIRIPVKKLERWIEEQG